MSQFFVCTESFLFFCCVSSSPEDCVAGEYSFSRATQCRPCPAGYQCPTKAGYTPCSVGSYSVRGQEDCTVCTAGNACPSKTNPNAMYACPAGKKRKKQNVHQTLFHCYTIL